MARRRKLVNFGVLVLLVAAGIYFVSRYWSQGADSVPATALLGASATTSRNTPAQAGGAAAGGSRAKATTAPAAASGTTAAQGALAQARLRQAQAESRELDQLRAVAGNASANATVRAQAQEQIVQLEQFQEEEALAAVVLAAKGFPAAVVMLHAGGATVLVPQGPFDATKAAMVAQAVAAIASLDPSQVQIVPTA